MERAPLYKLNKELAPKVNAFRGLESFDVPEKLEKKIELPLEPIEKIGVSQAKLDAEYLRLKEWEASLITREQDLDERARAVFDIAQNDGLQSGYREGWEISGRERELLINLSSSIESEFIAVRTSLAPCALELAVHAARHVVHESCSLSIENTYKNLSAVVSGLDLNTGLIEISCNSRTAKTLENQNVAESLRNRFTIKIDESLEDMGFLVTHGKGSIDSTIETRWKRALSQIHSGVEYAARSDQDEVGSVFEARRLSDISKHDQATAPPHGDQVPNKEINVEQGVPGDSDEFLRRK